MKTLFKLVGIILTLALLAAVMAYLAGFFEPKIPVDLKGVLPAAEGGRLVIVTPTTEAVVEQAAGTVRAKAETVISSLITAVISSMEVRAGDEVAAGDVLVVLDARDLKARAGQASQAVASARARLGGAQKEYQRVQKIYKKDSGAVSKAQLERTEAAQRIAQAELRGPGRVKTRPVRPAATPSCWHPSAAGWWSVTQTPETPPARVNRCCACTIRTPCAWKPTCASRWPPFWPKTRKSPLESMPSGAA